MGERKLLHFAALSSANDNAVAAFIGDKESSISKTFMQVTFSGLGTSKEHNQLGAYRKPEQNG